MKMLKRISLLITVVSIMLLSGCGEKKECGSITPIGSQPLGAFSSASYNETTDSTDIKTIVDRVSIKGKLKTQPRKYVDIVTLLQYYCDGVKKYKIYLDAEKYDVYIQGAE